MQRLCASRITKGGGRLKFENISNKEYRDRPGLSASEIKAMAKSMAYYKWTRDNAENKDTPALLFGRAYHKFCLEPSDFFNEFAIAPNVDKRTKAGKEEWERFANENQGKDIISQDVFDTLQKMRDALYATPFAKKLIYGEHEKSFFWHNDELDLDMKCRPDSYGKIGNTYICVDLKTCQNADTDKFMRKAIDLGYDIQASHYLEGLKAITGNDFTFIFIAQEKDPPYCVNILESNSYFIKSGAETRKALLEQYKECLARDEWPAYMGFNDEAEINTLGVPKFIQDMLGDDELDE